MNVFVLNCGSSSVKFQIINTDLELFESEGDKMIAKGIIEKVGTKKAIINLQAGNDDPFKSSEPIEDHRAAIMRIKA